MNATMLFRNVAYSVVLLLVVVAAAVRGQETMSENSVDSESMYSVFVIINVKPEYREAFVEASRTEAQGTVGGEAGVFQFHMLVDETNPNRFYFFEIYRDEQALEAHKETDVFRAWWDTVEKMFDGELERVSTMRTVFPSVEGLKKQKSGLANW